MPAMQHAGERDDERDTNFPDTVDEAAAAALRAARKHWLLSRVLWFNAFMAALAAAEASAGVLQPLLSFDAYAVLVFTLAAGNAALRTVTTQRLTTDLK